MHWRVILISVASLAVCLSKGQTISPTPGSVEDLYGQFPFTSEFSFEQEIQIGTQGNPNSDYPWKYAHGLQFRPWFHYDGIPNTTLTGGISYIYYFVVPDTSYYRHHEWRHTLMATVKQQLPEGSIYEQIRGELLSFEDSHGVEQNIPRLRIRFGQNLFLGEGSERISKPYLGLYQEAVMQFPRPSYSHVTLTSAEFFGGAGLDLGSRTTILLGFKALADVSSSGSTLTLFFGPAFSLEYNFRSRQSMHEHHQRTTAFKDF